jgi:hypothetical protein
VDEAEFGSWSSEYGDWIGEFHVVDDGTDWVGVCDLGIRR